MRAVASAVVGVGVGHRDQCSTGTARVVGVAHEVVARDDARAWKRRAARHTATAEGWVVDVDAGVNDADLHASASQPQGVLHDVNAREGDRVGHVCCGTSSLFWRRCQHDFNRVHCLHPGDAGQLGTVFCGHHNRHAVEQRIEGAALCQHHTSLRSGGAEGGLFGLHHGKACAVGHWFACEFDKPELGTLRAGNRQALGHGHGSGGEGGRRERDGLQSELPGRH